MAENSVIELEEAIRLIQENIRVHQARCIIFNEEPHESLLLGTRDGFLNVARILLEFVVEAEQGKYKQENGDAPHSTAIRQAMHTLPDFGTCFIVGMEMFESHADFRAELRRLVDSQKPRYIGNPFNDPQFNDSQFEEPTQ